GFERRNSAKISDIECYELEVVCDRGCGNPQIVSTDRCAGSCQLSPQLCVRARDGQVDWQSWKRGEDAFYEGGSLPVRGRRHSGSLERISFETMPRWIRMGWWSAYRTCPRISPGGNCVVCTLAYALPA